MSWFAFPEIEPVMVGEAQEHKSQSRKLGDQIFNHIQKVESGLQVGRGCTLSTPTPSDALWSARLQHLNVL